MNNNTKIGVFINTDKEKSNRIFNKLKPLLKQYDESFFVYEYTNAKGTDEDEMKKLLEYSDVIFSIGGDGTLLSIQRRVMGTNIEVVGINAGRKGFLIELDESTMEEAVVDYFDGNYYIEHRRTLYGCIEDVKNKKVNTSDVAINEFSVSRNGNTGIIKLKIYVDGELTEVFSADGVLISTPTGSTAYSLSAGGPVVMPGVRCIIITPVCAHSLHTRPFVAPDDVTIEIVPEYREGRILLIADGQSSKTIPQGCKVVIRQSELTADLVRFDVFNKYAVFRDKMLQHTD